MVCYIYVQILREGRFSPEGLFLTMNLCCGLSTLGVGWIEGDGRGGDGRERISILTDRRMARWTAETTQSAFPPLLLLAVNLKCTDIVRWAPSVGPFGSRMHGHPFLGKRPPRTSPRILMSYSPLSGKVGLSRTRVDFRKAALVSKKNRKNHLGELHKCSQILKCRALPLQIDDLASVRLFFPCFCRKLRRFS